MTPKPYSEKEMMIKGANKKALGDVLILLKLEGVEANLA